jgi:hypothetical protein
MGDPNSNAQDSPACSPGAGMESKLGSPSPVPNNVVFIDDIPIDFELPIQQQLQDKQQQQLQHQFQLQQQQQQQHGSAVAPPNGPAPRKPKCLGALRCNVM